MPIYRYAWPASALTSSDMAALHAVRESCLPRVPITELVARAVRLVYGEAAHDHSGPTIQREDPRNTMKEAA